MNNQAFPAEEGETVVTSDPISDWCYPGARWWKFDFHTHTPESADYGQGADQPTLKQTEPTEWLLAVMRTGVDCVAVTDHNSGDWTEKLKEALQELADESHPDFRPLYLFPGVEITANGGTHILAILDTGKSSADVATLLGAVEYHGERGACEVTANKSPIEVVEAIVNFGGIPILAHVDQPSGAWELKGNTLSPLLEFDGLFAMEVVDPTAKKPAKYRQRKLNWAEVLGSDSHDHTGKTGSRVLGTDYTWVKMAEPSLEGLRLALLDGGGFSIRRSDDPRPFDPYRLPDHFVEALEVRDAQFMGRGDSVKLSFSPWLNALVGGRGTGKSTAVHGIRIASRRDLELESFEENCEPRVIFDQFNRVPGDRTDRGGLTDSTEIKLTVMRNDVRYRVRWKCDGSGIVVEEDAGELGWAPSNIQSVTPERFPIRIFSQGQIAALAGENQKALLQVIDDASGVVGLQRQFDDVKSEFYAARARIRELDGKLVRSDDLSVEKEDVERKLKRFEEARHGEILTLYQRRIRQQRETERQFEATNAAAKRIEDATNVLHPEDVPDGLFDRESDEDCEALIAIGALASAIKTAAETLQCTAEGIREVVTKQRSVLSNSKWHEAVNEIVSQYQQLVETLQSEGVADPSEYGRLVQERQRLDREIAVIKSIRKERCELEKECRALLERVLETRQAVSKGRDDFLAETLAKNRFVRIQSLTYGDDARVIENGLREVLDVLDDRFEIDILDLVDESAERGIVADLIADLTEKPERRQEEMEKRIDRLKKRFVSACSGHGNFGGHFNNYLQREFEKSPEFLDGLLTWFPEDSLRVEYSQLGDGTDFRPITQASSGQRSAAMLAFLLAYGAEPLVLDQPEDDLDNHLIYDLVVRQIRENKLRRQIIVVTHNPNIVVNGDAEMLYALEFVNGQCIVEQSGSLQQEAMREEVCRIMEGGRVAFERRYRRLGPEPAHV